jgi:hypothetical protein
MHARLSRRLGRASVAAIAAAVLMTAGPTTAEAEPGHGHANGHGKGHCRAFQALGDGVDNGDPDGDGQGTTTATIHRGKHVLGTTVGTIVPGPIVDGELAFTGTIVFTDDQGTLSAPVEGTFNLASGEFAARSDDVTGTGGYALTTGKLRVWGVQNLEDGTFTEHLLAKLCVAKHNPH